MLKTKKKNSYKFGIIAENIARIYLFFKFYNILEKRYRNSAGEIDIIAKRGNILVFIEVKARRNDDMEVLTFRQKERIKRAAMIFISKKNIYCQYNIRFDLIIIKPYNWPVHIKNAW